MGGTLGEEIKRARLRAIPDTVRPITGTGSTHSSGLVPARACTDSATLVRYRDAWDHAADRTPHGQPSS